MPYSFILPAFLLYLLALSVVLVVTLLYRPAAHLRRYVSSVLISGRLWVSLSQLPFMP